MPRTKVEQDKDTPKVYLDHLIRRENLRYQQRQYSGVSGTTDRNERLSLISLAPSVEPDADYLVGQLRKPDFQRATFSWTADDCVRLLESFVKRLVVPGIVIWSSPYSSYHYILDGAHRVSVIMAWLRDDWGDKVPMFEGRSLKQENLHREAAKIVREQVRKEIGFINEFKADYEEFKRIEQHDGRFESMGERRHQRALFYRDYAFGKIGFRIQWVDGDHDIAEESFLRINRSGRQLSAWETRVTQYRNSSAMRVIMSIASGESSEHYWPDDFPEGRDGDRMRRAIPVIHEGIDILRAAVFSPAPERPFKPSRQPLLGNPTQPERPGYLGGLLCVLMGSRGTPAEIDTLLERDKKALPAEVIANGEHLVNLALAGLSNLTGNAIAAGGKRLQNQNQNKSLGIVPLLYFYNMRGDHIRGMLYGFLFWLLHGDSAEQLARKRAFVCYREGFEQILLTRKADVVGGLSRKSGSGADITAQTARYFQGVLEILAANGGQSQSGDFIRDYKALVRQLIDKDASEPIGTGAREAAGRLFSPKQKYVANYLQYFKDHTRCGICRGYLDLADDVQHDHIIEHARGGKTNAQNQQIVHPFCNNPDTKQLVLDVQAGRKQISPPPFKT